MRPSDFVSTDDDLSGEPVRVVLALDPLAERLAMPSVTGIEMRVEPTAIGSIPTNASWLGNADLLIVEVDAARPSQVDIFTRLAALLPIPVVAASRTLTVDATRRLMRAGAVDVLPLPITAEDLGHAVAHTRRDVPQSGSGQRQGKLIAFLGAIGGSGVTSIATQAGCLWAATRSTCIIDLDVQFGSAALYLNVKPQLNLVDLTDAGERLDADILKAVAARHPSGLSVVAAPSEMMPLDMLTPALVLQIITVATQLYDLVLVDLPAAWTDWTLAVLARADQVVLVTALTVPGIHHARRKLDLMDANNLRPRVILNRVPHKLFRTIDFDDTQKVLRRKVDFQIANDYPTVSGTIDQGRTLAQVKRGSRVEKDLGVFVAALAAVLDTVEAP